MQTAHPQCGYWQLRDRSNSTTILTCYACHSVLSVSKWRRRQEVITAITTNADKNSEYLALDEGNKNLVAATLKKPNVKCPLWKSNAYIFQQSQWQTGVYFAVQPPSIMTLVPVVWLAACEHKNTTISAICQSTWHSGHILIKPNAGRKVTEQQDEYSLSTINSHLTSLNYFNYDK